MNVHELPLCECGLARAVSYHPEGCAYCPGCEANASAEAMELIGLQLIIDGLRSAIGAPALLRPCPQCDTREHDGTEARIEECSSLFDAFGRPPAPSEMIEQMVRYYSGLRKGEADD